MSRENQIRFWLAGLAVFALLLYLLSSVLMPFVAGMAVAYFLDPVADRLEKAGASRLVAASLIVAAFFVTVVLLLVLLFPLLQAQILGLIGKVPDAVQFFRDQAAVLVEGLRDRLSPEDMARLRDAAGGYVGNAIQWLGGLVKGLLSGGLVVFELVSLAIITPLVSFYLLRDWDHIVEKVDGYLPRRPAPVIRAQVKAIDATIAGFVRGQATVCLILAAFYGIALTLAGLEFGLLVGLSAGLISFIPYFGALFGGAMALGIAIAQFPDWGPVAVIAAIFAAGQVAEGNFLTPKLVGGRVGLHPVWVIFALLAGGALFGFTGLLLAVPVAAVIGVLVRFSLDQYKNSALYHGTSAAAKAAALSSAALISEREAGDGGDQTP